MAYLFHLFKNYIFLTCTLKWSTLRYFFGLLSFYFSKGSPSRKTCILYSYLAWHTTPLRSRNYITRCHTSVQVYIYLSCSHLEKSCLQFIWSSYKMKVFTLFFRKLLLLFPSSSMGTYLVSLPDDF